MIRVEAKKVERRAREGVSGLRNPSEDDVHASWLRALADHEGVADRPDRIANAERLLAVLDEVVDFLGSPFCVSAHGVRMFESEQFSAFQGRVYSLRHEAQMLKNSVLDSSGCPVRSADSFFSRTIESQKLSR